ncbi:hypothetical protein HPB50_006303 [Hyalomma asiaticum]|uniref:Uncharacterized protein n=1 Tax=Hyalomma asiaticum TaxID=266040 RepID=A0ACB7SF09_HYAAI|nr:hypothetical protein HPB50_006303 [Hyalomma asiaticum]
MTSQVRRMVSVALHAGLSGPDGLLVVRRLLENPSKDSWPGNVSVVPACGLYLMRVQYNPAQSNPGPNKEILSVLKELKSGQTVIQEQLNN